MALILLPLALISSSGILNIFCRNYADSSKCACIPSLKKKLFCKVLYKDVICRFLATGDSFGTIAFSYRLGESTTRKIVYETCEAIWNTLQPIVMPKMTEEMWIKKEEVFYCKWYFPNCVGAMDGKHVVFQKPKIAARCILTIRKFAASYFLRFSMQITNSPYRCRWFWKKQRWRDFFTLHIRAKIFARAIKLSSK